MKALAILLVALSCWSCQGLFTPSGCTQTVVIVDSMKVAGDSTWHVDTISRFKLCAQ